MLDADTNVKRVGSWSVSVTPVAVAGPLLRTWSVIVDWLDPTWTLCVTLTSALIAWNVAV